MARTGTAPDTHFAEVWRTHHSYLVDLAFGMVGNIATAEDAVQEAFARLARTDLDQIEEVRGWLIVVTTRICLDHIRAAPSRRERPVDPAPGQAAEGTTRVTGVVASGATPPDPADRVTFDDEVRLACSWSCDD